jgi:hypothetical protein
VLGNVASVQLGAAVDRLTVPLYDDRDFHCESRSEPVDAVPGEALGLVSGGVPTA